MYGRSLAIKVSRRGIRPHQAVLIAGFEFVSVSRQCFEIRDSVVTCAGGKDGVEDERAESRVSARASSTNRHPRSIGITAFLQIPGRIDTILDVRSEEHTSELQSPMYLVCRLLL